MSDRINEVRFDRDRGIVVSIFWDGIEIIREEDEFVLSIDGEEYPRGKDIGEVLKPVQHRMFAQVAEAAFKSSTAEERSLYDLFSDFLMAVYNTAVAAEPA